MTEGSEADLHELVGRVVGDRYLLRELLGSGGFGGVFRTDQYVLGRPIRKVACKVSRITGVTEETAGALFADVLQLAGAIEEMTDAQARRHLVHIYDGGIARDLDGRAFLVMEYVLGRSLAEEFKAYGAQRVPPALLLKWARQIAVALRGLHTQNPPLLHRDLKPDNVLLGADGTIRLIDFGLAARMLADGTVPGTVGTIQYMAPETANGASIPASDVYSLGLLMYEGLTGRYAFEHLAPPVNLPSALHSGWLLRQKNTSPPPPPSAIDSTLPKSLDTLVMACLETQPENRVRTAEEVIAAIDALDGGAGGTGPGEEALELVRRWSSGSVPGHTVTEALSAGERALRDPRLEPATRYGLLRGLGEIHDRLGAHAEAARRFAEAGEQLGRLRVEPSERCDLLMRTEQAFRNAGNAYQAERFAQRRRAECGGR
ncbi:MAG: serine/threonine-protein kinase [Catenulispora sp.]